MVQSIVGVAIATGVVFCVVGRKIKKGTNKVMGRDEDADHGVCGESDVYLQE